MESGASLGVGALRDGRAHPSGRAEYPEPYRVGTAIGEFLRVESLLRVAEGRLLYLVNNLGPKWNRRKCWSCGNRYSPDLARCCTHCFTPLRDQRLMMVTRWDAEKFVPFESFATRRLSHFGLVTPVAVYYRAGNQIAIYHYNGEHLLADEPSPLQPDRLVAIARALVEVLTFLHESGVVIGRVGPEHILVMPDGSVRLYDPDVLDLRIDGSAAARHPSRPLARLPQTICALLLRYCPSESADLQELLEQGVAGAVPSLPVLVNGLARLEARDLLRAVSTRACAMSDTGLLRAMNEDAWAWRRIHDRAVLYAVADGMGGHDAGEVASRVALGALIDALRKMPPQAAPDAIEQILHDAIVFANQAVLDEGARTRLRMGSTLVAALIVDKTLYVGHAGDSRLYRLRGGALERLTRDHSVVQNLVDAGKVSPDEARKHPKARLLTSTIGSRLEDLDIDTGRSDLLPRDRLLLCSDGAWGELPDTLIARLLGTHGQRRDAALALVRAVYEAGAEDNVTVQIVDP